MFKGVKCYVKPDRPEDVYLVLVSLFPVNVRGLGHDCHRGMARMKCIVGMVFGCTVAYLNKSETEKTM